MKNIVKVLEMVNMEKVGAVLSGKGAIKFGKYTFVVTSDEEQKQQQVNNNAASKKSKTITKKTAATKSTAKKYNDKTCYRRTR